MGPCHPSSFPPCLLPTLPPNLSLWDGRSPALPHHPAAQQAGQRAWETRPSMTAVPRPSTQEKRPPQTVAGRPQLSGVLGGKVRLQPQVRLEVTNDSSARLPSLTPGSVFEDPREALGPAWLEFCPPPGPGLLLLPPPPMRQEKPQEEEAAGVGGAFPLIPASLTHQPA